MYSDIINKDRNMGRGKDFMKKMMSCVLVGVTVRENSKQKDKGIIVFSFLEGFLFPMEEGRLSFLRAVEPNNKSIHYYKYLDLE